MLFCEGQLRMRRGDYGVPLTLHVIEHCQECAEELEREDIIRAELLRGGQTEAAWEETMEDLEADGGMMELYLLQEEAEWIELGLHTFRVLLLREGEVRNTLMETVMEVVP